MRIRRWRSYHLSSCRQVNLNYLHRVIRIAEYLLTEIAGPGIAPERLIDRPRQAVSVAFCPHQKARERQVEGGSQSHQRDGGGAYFLAFNLADRRLGDSGGFGQIR